METAPAKTKPVEQVLDHHLQAFLSTDIEEIMKDYTEQSEVWTPKGAIVGLEGISSFFSYVFTLLPRESTKLEMKQGIVKEDKVYIVWSAESALINIPAGTDCFEIRNGKIHWQTTAAHIVTK